MQRYLKSVGFSKFNNLSQQDELLRHTLGGFDYKKVVELDNGHLFAEISKEYIPGAGITVCGEYDGDHLFHMEYFFPFFKGTQLTSHEHVEIEQHARSLSFAGGCDDLRIGTMLIFYINNAAELIDFSDHPNFRQLRQSISLSGLGDEGSILLPVTKEQKHVVENKEEIENRSALYTAAQNGDEDAIESITQSDYELYTTISKRVQKEDIYTIVDSYFMPLGLECDRYSILGDITSVNRSYNTFTNESVIQMGLMCNDIPLDICINENDLIGVPEVGRRFKGSIWLQGKINF